MFENAGFTSIKVMQEPVVKDWVRSWAYTRADRGRLKGVNIEKLADDGLLNLYFSMKLRGWKSKSEHADRYHLVAVKS
jgi:hypothetical protein